jgi:diguanylate cyclase (GGDEF)-like protein
MPIDEWMIRLRMGTVEVGALGVACALLCGAVTLLARHLGAHPMVQAVIVAAVTLGPATGVVWLVHVDTLSRRVRAQRTQELCHLLDVATSESEVRSLLMTHTQRLAPEAGVVILTCGESDKRLEPAFGSQISGTPLRGLLVGHPPLQACLAVRLDRPHVRGSLDDGLTECELCGRLAGESICEPLRAGGRTLGALLVATVDPIPNAVAQDLHESVTRAAPMLALARTVATGERHAAQDPLTGLPNRRAAQEALARFSAQAGRTVTPLGAVLVDLDHFAAVNDRFGHEHGDDVLTTIGGTLARGVRASDFIARYGGQAFIVLTPDTDRRGATELAEKLRRDVEELPVPGVGRITASFGVASLPEDAAAGDDLVRRAERALAIAKALGRNRVAAADPSAAPEL